LSFFERTDITLFSKQYGFLFPQRLHRKSTSPKSNSQCGWVFPALTLKTDMRSLRRGVGEDSFLRHTQTTASPS
jgi:hypothetical protein